MNLRSVAGTWPKYERRSKCDMGNDELLSDTLMYDLWNLLSGMGWLKRRYGWEMITASFMNLMIVLFAGRLGE